MLNSKSKNKIIYLTALIPMIVLCGIQLLDSKVSITPSYHLCDLLLLFCVIVLITSVIIAKQKRVNVFINLTLYVSLLIYVLFAIMLFERIGIDISFGGLEEKLQMYSIFFICLLFLVSIIFDIISNSDIVIIIIAASLMCLFDFILIKVLKTELNNILFINMVSVKWISSSRKCIIKRKS
jgi:hypothetical protein